MFELVWSSKKIKDDLYNTINIIFKYNNKYYVEYYNNLTNKRYLNELNANFNIDLIYNKDLIVIEDNEEFKTLQSLVYDMNKFL